MSDMSGAVLKFAEKYLGDGNFYIRNGQVVARLCPFCKGGSEHKDEWTFAVGLYNGAWNCKRGSCTGKDGSFKKLADSVGMAFDSNIAGQLRSEPQKKNYVLPSESILRPLTIKAEMYFAMRHISRDTVDAFNVGCDEHGDIIFPFYRDKRLTYVKYRPPVKNVKEAGLQKEWQMSNTEEILFGMDNASFNEPIAITEGMMDALALYEAGYHNVVSVPAGCDHYGWIENCWDWLEKGNSFILFGDNDACGRTFMDTVKKRLGEDRCMMLPEYPAKIVDEKPIEEQCKDANEILCCYGPEFLRQFIEEAKPEPVKGIFDLGRLEDFDITAIPTIYTGIPAFDRATGGLIEGGMTLLSGKRGSGKSTISGTWMLNAIEQGYKVCLYSGELTQYNVADWIYLQACESNLITYKVDQTSGRVIPVLPQETRKRIKEWLTDKFYLYDNSYVDGDVQDCVLKTFEICARKFGCKLFVLDNTMCLTLSGDEENRAQVKLVGRLKAFANKYKVHVVLVSHPRKTKAGEAMTNDDVAGASALTNLADTVLFCMSPNVKVEKSRATGETPFIQCNYDPANRRVFETDIGDRYRFSWNHEGITEPENKITDLEHFAVQVGEPPIKGTMPNF